MTEIVHTETFDVSMTVSSNNGTGRSYLSEQQQVPPEETPMALATCLKALMGQLHPGAAVMIDPSLLGGPPEDERPIESLDPAVHGEIVTALKIVKAWVERGEKYATLTAEQVGQVAGALTAADAMAHVLAGQGVVRVGQVEARARVLLGEAGGVPVFREGAVELDGDRPDGSLLITLDPALRESEVEFMRVGTTVTELLSGILATLLRLNSDGEDYCRVCGMELPAAPEGLRPMVDAATWALHHFRDAECWRRPEDWLPVDHYVPVTMIRPGDEVRIEFQQDDGTFVHDPVNNGDKLDHGYVTDTVIQLESGVFALADDNRTPLQAHDEPKEEDRFRLRRIFLVKRGEWSAAVQDARRSRDKLVTTLDQLRSCAGSGVSLDETLNAVRLLRQQAGNRRIYLSRIAEALGLPRLAEDGPAGTEVETVRGILSRITADTGV